MFLPGRVGAGVATVCQHVWGARKPWVGCLGPKGGWLEEEGEANKGHVRGEAAQGPRALAEEGSLTAEEEVGEPRGGPELLVHLASPRGSPKCVYCPHFLPSQVSTKAGLAPVAVWVG